MIYAVTGPQHPAEGIEGRVYSVLVQLVPWRDTILTGACIGVDTITAMLAYDMGFEVGTIVPADKSRIDPDYALHCTWFELMPPGTTYMDRNLKLVTHPLYPADALLAFPDFLNETQRSGTWSTVRRARDIAKIPVLVTGYSRRF